MRHTGRVHRSWWKNSPNTSLISKEAYSTILIIAALEILANAVYLKRYFGVLVLKSALILLSSANLVSSRPTSPCLFIALRCGVEPISWWARSMLSTTFFTLVIMEKDAQTSRPPQAHDLWLLSTRTVFIKFLFIFVIAKERLLRLFNFRTRDIFLVPWYSQSPYIPLLFLKISMPTRSLPRSHYMTTTMPW